MKNRIIIILVVLFLICAAFAIYFQSKAEKLLIEDILPNEVSIYLKASDTEDVVKKISSSKLWGVISNLDFEKLKVKDPSKVELCESIQRIKTVFSQNSVLILMQKFFGQEFALSFYTPEVNFSEYSNASPQEVARITEEIVSKVFFVTRVNRDVQFVEFFLRFFDKKGLNIKTEKMSYKENTIHLITFNEFNLTLGLVRIKDLLVLGIGDNAAMSCIDVYNGTRKSLKDDERFQMSKKRAIKDSNLLGYLDSEKIIDLLKSYAMDLAQKKNIDKKNIDKAFAQKMGIKSFVLSAKLDDLAKFKFDVNFDRSKLDKDFLDFYTCSSEINDSINYIPKNILGYHWSNCLKLEGLIDQMKNKIGMMGGEASDSGMSSKFDEVGLFLTQTGEKLLGAADDEFGGYLADIQMGQSYPIPEIVLFLKVKDKNKMQEVISGFLNNPMLVIQEEEYKNIAINYLFIPLGGQIEPSYCFIDNYFFVALNRKSLKETIDISADKTLALDNSDNFNEINLGLTDANRSVSYFRIDKLSRRMRSVFNWINDWVSQGDANRIAFKSGAERRLADIRKQVSDSQDMMSKKTEEIESLENQVWDMESEGKDISELKSKIEKLKEEVASLEVEIDSGYENIEELKAVLKGYEKKPVEPDLRRYYLDEFVFPMLKGLESIKSLGVRSTLINESIESTMFFKIVE